MGFDVSRLVLFTFFLVPKLVCGAYDPDHPPATENFDPTEANPVGKMYCLGHPLTPMPNFGDFHPNTYTMQDLCVKTQYGGGIRGFHAGGYCFGNDLVVFDNSPGANTHPRLSNARFWQQCRLRCFCATNAIWQGGNPWAKYWTKSGSEIDYPIKADLIDDFGQLPHFQRSPAGYYHYSLLQIATEVVVRRNHLALDTALRDGTQANEVAVRDYAQIRTGLDPINHVSGCDSILFPFAISNYDSHSLNSVPVQYRLRALCVNALDGGNS